MKERTRYLNGRDFAIIFAILVGLIVGFSSAYASNKYDPCRDHIGPSFTCTQEESLEEVPWYAENPILNTVIAVPIAALIGWFVGLSIPVSDPLPTDRGHASYCPRCRMEVKRGDRFCESCGLHFAER